MNDKKKQKIIEAVQRFAFNKLNLNIDFKIREGDDDGVVCLNSDYYPISTSRIGLMEIVISDIEVEVKSYFKLGDDGYYGKLRIEIHFVYNHQSGGGNGSSNTYSFETRSDSGGDLTLIRTK